MVRRGQQEITQNHLSGESSGSTRHGGKRGWEGRSVGLREGALPWLKRK